MSPSVSTNTQTPTIQASVANNEPHIVIEGGYPLSGSIQVAGSKNAALALIAGTLLATTGVTVLHNLPNITDIADLVRSSIRWAPQQSFLQGIPHSL